MPGSRRRWFAAAALALGTFGACLSLFLVDLRIHHKFERGVLYNEWGYRGPALGRKAPGEYRIAVLGGSAAFGFGVAWEESMPRLLEQRLDATRPSMRVVNLAYNGQGAYAFVPTMDDYAYLKPDMVVLYESYNDLLSGPDRPTKYVFRRESPVFRLTGYLPIFSIVAREKASVLVYGDTRGVYTQAQHAQTVFEPGLARKTSAQILRSAAAVQDSLERQFDKVVSQPRDEFPATARAAGCGGTWAAYCELEYDAIRVARSRGLKVLVVTQPYALGERLRAAHIEQQREVAEMIARDFAADRGVAYINVGNTVDLSDPELCFDRMHLTARGNARIADALAPAVLSLSQ